MNEAPRLNLLRSQAGVLFTKLSHSLLANAFSLIRSFPLSNFSNFRAEIVLLLSIEMWRDLTEDFKLLLQARLVFFYVMFLGKLLALVVYLLFLGV